MPVLKHTSPTGAGLPVCAPKPRPQNTEPSARTSAAVAPEGGVFWADLGSCMGALIRLAGSPGGVPARSGKVRPVAAITAAQCLAGMDRDWRHLRTASGPTPVSLAAASAPPSFWMISSTLIVMR